MSKHSFKTYSILAASLLSCAYTFTDETVQETSLVNHISHRYLTSTFGPDKSIVNTPVNEEALSFLEKFNKQFDSKKHTLSPRETQSIAFDLVAQSSFTTTIIDSSCVDKLEIVNGGENTQQYLLENIFNNIQTTIGKAYSAITFCHPTTNIALLQNRQQAIAYISKNKHLTDTCTTALTTIAAQEGKSLQVWHSVSPVNAELLKNFYFGSWLKSLNTKTLALELYNKGVCSFQIAWGTIGIPALKIFLNSMIYEVDPITAAQITLARITSPEIPLSIKALENFDLALQGIHTYRAAMSLKSTGEISNHLQDQLIATASHINALKTLSTQLKKNKQLVTYLPSLQPLADFNDATKHSAKLNKLLSMLDTNTFIGEASFWSITGRVLAAYELLKQVKDELAPVFAAAGELDMYIALAQLYNSREGKDAQYCMVNFIENSAIPVIDAHNFWNPFINPDAVVTNNVTFDASCPNSILTGPNTGGKSTVIKGIMLNVLMAQTFGIAPSESLTLTPFAKLNCFMNISDDIATGASLFKSEVARAKKLLELVQSLDKTEFSFVIIDEVFTGTSPQEGEVAAMRFTKHMGTYTNNISIIATHYPKMVDLETETNGTYRNHHVEILRNEDGSLNRTFKLKNGPSFFNVAFDILEEEGLFV